MGKQKIIESRNQLIENIQKESTKNQKGFIKDISNLFY